VFRLAISSARNLPILFSSLPILLFLYISCLEGIFCNSLGSNAHCESFFFFSFSFFLSLSFLFSFLAMLVQKIEELTDIIKCPGDKDLIPSLKELALVLVSLVGLLLKEKTADPLIGLQFRLQDILKHSPHPFPLTWIEPSIVFIQVLFFYSQSGCHLR